MIDHLRRMKIASTRWNEIIDAANAIGRHGCALKAELCVAMKDPTRQNLTRCLMAARTIERFTVTARLAAELIEEELHSDARKSRK